MFSYAVILFIILGYFQRWYTDNQQNDQRNTQTISVGLFSGVMWGLLFILYTYHNVARNKSVHKIVSPERVVALMQAGMFHHVLSTSAHTLWLRYMNTGAPFWAHVTGIVIGSVVMTYTMGRIHEGKLG